MAERKKTIMKAMAVQDLSFDLVIAMERELLFYTDQLIYGAARASAMENDLEKKLEAWGAIADTATLHQAIHHQLLTSLRDIKEDQESLPEGDRELPSARTLACRFPVESFDVIVRAFNSPYLDPKSSSKDINYWHQLHDKRDKKSMLEDHKTLIKIMKGAEPTYIEVDDEEEDEDGVIEDSSMMRMATMPTPKMKH